MRLLVVVVVALLAGCTSSFPDDARQIAELEMGDLAAGDGASTNFTLASPAEYLLLGFRTGPMEHVHVVLVAPNGTAYDTSDAQRAGPCLVTRPAAGAWRLDVRADAFDGRLGGGKFTVRAGAGEPPALFPCRDAPFPGPGRNVTLRAWTLNLTANETADDAFDQPHDVSALRVALRGEGNATVLLAAPGGEFAPAADAPMPPPLGTWRVRVVAADASLQNWTLAIQAARLASNVTS